MIHHLFSSWIFDTILPIFMFILTSVWVCSLWLHHKYDKDINYLVLLIIGNVYYAPFYLLRIRKIKKENKIKSLSEEIYDSNFIKLSKTGVIQTLKLWASEKEQIESQKSDIESQYPLELFQQWDNFYQIDNKILQEAFNEFERDILKTFDESLQTCREKYADDFPELEVFQRTNDWYILNELAVNIIKELKE